MKKNYRCSICGKKHVKLWRPYTANEPLICATCAEERQVPREYHELDSFGKPTGRKLPLEKWKINKKGQIPTEHGPGPDGRPLAMTEQLIVELKDNVSGITTMVPAIPADDGKFWSYAAVPDVPYQWWKKLPLK